MYITKVIHKYNYTTTLIEEIRNKLNNLRNLRLISIVNGINNLTFVFKFCTEETNYQYYLVSDITQFVSNLDNNIEIYMIKERMIDNKHLIVTTSHTEIYMIKDTDINEGILKDINKEPTYTAREISDLFYKLDPDTKLTTEEIKQYLEEHLTSKVFN